MRCLLSREAEELAANAAAEAAAASTSAESQRWKMMQAPQPSVADHAAAAAALPSACPPPCLLLPPHAFHPLYCLFLALSLRVGEHVQLPLKMLERSVVNLKRQTAPLTNRRESIWTGYSQSWLRHWRQTKNYTLWQTRVRHPPNSVLNAARKLSATAESGAVAERCGVGAVQSLRPPCVRLNA